jgi:photosystem II stability/assembly factor-like uncharacterized protein
MNTGLPNSEIRCIAGNDSNIFAGTWGYGIYKFNKNGLIWQAVNSGLPTNAIVLSLAVNGFNIYAGTEDPGGVFISNNNGFSWEIATQTAYYPVSSLFVKDSYIFAGTAGYGIYLSNDNGMTWSSKNNGLRDDYEFIWSFSSVGSIIIAGTSSGVYSSTNNGINWNSINSGLNFIPITTMAIRDSVIFAGTISGMYKSNNKGGSWNYMNVLGPTTINQLVINGNDIFAGLNGMGVYLSTNNGESWEERNFGLTDRYIGSLAILDSNIIAGTSSGVFLSNNNGNSWTSVNNGLPNPTFVFSVAFSGTNIFAGTDKGLFLSTNYGQNWEHINLSPMHDDYITAIAAIDTNIFVGDNFSVYFSNDRGKSWVQIDDGFLTFDVITAFAKVGTNIFVTTYFSGIFMLTNNGTKWTPVSTGFPNVRIDCIAGDNDHVYIGSTASVWKRPLSEFQGIGIEEYKNSERVTVYPNPAKDEITVALSLQVSLGIVSTVSVFDIHGRELINTQFRGSESQININFLPRGIYFFIISNEKMYAVRKIIKE